MKIYSLCLLLLIFLFTIDAPLAFTQKQLTRIDGRDTIPTGENCNSAGLDTTLYNEKLLALAHHDPSSLWPVKTRYPLPGAILPMKRIVAYYGNFYAPAMGILGEQPTEKMLEDLRQEVEKWQQADSSTLVQPALHFIAVIAQRNPGKDGKYRLRMPFDQVDKALHLAEKINAIVFLEIQVGHSTLEQEIPLLEKYLRLPQVHLGIDPEYSMKGGDLPGSVIGTYDAADINFASGYLAAIAREYNLPPKILVIHRFTKAMVTNYQRIITRPEVQIVMNMDGFGYPAKKIGSYKSWIANQPVQFTGFKLFYRQDTQRLMQPDDILKLYPKPVYIQYQ